MTIVMIQTTPQFCFVVLLSLFFNLGIAPHACSLVALMFMDLKYP
jgi:hypothetical protein